MKRKEHPVLFSVIQWTYGVFQNLLGAVIALFVKISHPDRKAERFRECAVFRWNRPGSMSLGMFLFLGNYAKEREKFILRHEYGHSLQSLILGPLYLPVIGLPSFLRANVPLFSKNWRSGKKGYYEFYPERWANRISRAEEICEV
jgi:hypothetical protein